MSSEETLSDHELLAQAGNLREEARTLLHDGGLLSII